MQKHWKEILWPLGGTLFGLFVVPIAIAQYPDFFNENRWLLPASVFIVAVCWLLPLLIPRNIQRLLVWVISRGGGSIAVSILLALGLLVALGFGCVRLFRLHEKHLSAVLERGRLNSMASQTGTKAIAPDSTHVEENLEKKLDEIERNTRPPLPGPAFSVDIEHRIITEPSKGTSFWFGSFLFSRCSLQPTSAAIFLRITNRQQEKEMIAAYSIEGLTRIPISHGRMFVILPKGSLGAGYIPKTIDFGAPRGMGMLVGFPVDDVDTSKAIPVTGDFLDYTIGEGHYLERDQSARGWVFFDYHKARVVIPARLTIGITDQFQRTFTYPISDHIGDPEGDLLPRRIVEGPLEDLSRCTVITN